MKIKNRALCSALAAVMLFSGCSEKNTSSMSQTESAANTANFDGNMKDVTPKSGDLIATFEIEGYDGAIKAVLFPEVAPVGVENFQKLCDAGFYKGLKIHRVLKGFMFQGGSANGDGTGGDALVNGGKFSIETAENARHFYGALCYANAGPDNNSTQFYIVNNKQTNIDDTVSGLNDQVSQCDDLIKQFKAAGQDDAVTYYESTKKRISETADKLDGFSAEVKARYGEKGGAPTLDGDYTVFGQVYEGFDVIDKLSDAEVADNGGGEVSKPVKDIIIKNVTVSTFE